MRTDKKWSIESPTRRFFVLFSPGSVWTRKSLTSCCFMAQSVGWMCRIKPKTRTKGRVGTTVSFQSISSKTGPDWGEVFRKSARVFVSARMYWAGNSLLTVSPKQRVGPDPVRSAKAKMQKETFVLVDTPGLDEYSKTAEDILNEVNAWMKKKQVHKKIIRKLRLTKNAIVTKRRNICCNCSWAQTDSIRQTHHWIPCQ